jgi:hypothetical protein
MLERLHTVARPPHSNYHHLFDRDPNNRSRCYERSHLLSSGPREVRAVQRARKRLRERYEERLEAGRLFIHGDNGARATGLVMILRCIDARFRKEQIEVVWPTGKWISSSHA